MENLKNTREDIYENAKIDSATKNFIETEAEDISTNEENINNSNEGGFVNDIKEEGVEENNYSTLETEVHVLMEEIEDTQAKLNEIREGLGLEPTDEQPPSVMYQKERLQEITVSLGTMGDGGEAPIDDEADKSKELEKLELEKRRLIKQQEKNKETLEKFIEKEKEEIEKKKKEWIPKKEAVEEGCVAISEDLKTLNQEQKDKIKETGKQINGMPYKYGDHVFSTEEVKVIINLIENDDGKNVGDKVIKLMPSILKRFESDPRFELFEERKLEEVVEDDYSVEFSDDGKSFNVDSENEDNSNLVMNVMKRLAISWTIDKEGLNPEEQLVDFEVEATTMRNYFDAIYGAQFNKIESNKNSLLGNKGEDTENSEDDAGYRKLNDN